MATELINAVLQVLVFSLIPFVVYLITQKKAKGFLGYIGLKKSTTRANLLAILTSILFLIPAVGLTLFNDEFREVMMDPNTMTGKFRQMGFGINSVVILLAAAIFKTALAEEIFFRGFVAKRLMSWLGYQWGNIAQALIFGALHVLIFLAINSNLLFLVSIMVFATLGAYISAYLNEKLANGSIIPGWISHGLANVISYSVVGFLIHP